MIIAVGFKVNSERAVQFKMHYAIHGHTAAELIVERADSQKDYMGLTTWQDAPDGKIEKSDVTIAKNYLTEYEMFQYGLLKDAGKVTAEIAKLHAETEFEKYMLEFGNEEILD